MRNEFRVSGFLLKYVVNGAFVLTLAAAHLSGGTNPYLSNLNATKDSPLYATYAAAMERSEFALDEGYQFVFYDSSQGIDFTTDTAGDWCLAFRKGADFVYTLDQMYREPVITLSYPDMVRFHYFPFEDIRVEVTFLVYSSHVGIQDVEIANQGTETADIEVVPFLKNDYRTFGSVGFHQQDNAISFTHQELPDSWTLNRGVSMGIPYVDSVRNVFMLTRKPDRLTSFRSFKPETVDIPRPVKLDKESEHLLTGKIYHADGTECRHPDARKSFYLLYGGEVAAQLITLASPLWGTIAEPLGRRGRYTAELGNFADFSPGSLVTLAAHCAAENQSAVVRQIEITEKAEIHRDITLSEEMLPEPPQEIDKDIWGSGTEVRLFWGYADDADVSFNIYRRDYRRSDAYSLIADGIQDKFYTDKNIRDDKVYGYVVAAVNSDGEMSLPSKEINNIAQSDFMTDIRYPNQIRNQVPDYARVIASPFTASIAPQDHESFQVVRAVSRMDSSVQTLMESAESVTDLDLSEFQKANESLFSNVPVLEFDNPEMEMMYWNAFNMMRQQFYPPEGDCGYNYYLYSREPTWGWGHGGQVFHESLTMLAYAYLDPESAMNSQRVYKERQHENGYIAYRIGPYMEAINERDGQATTSAPWYAWENWEIYRITGDKEFLREMYQSSVDFYHYYTQSRDSDGDGLVEWGGRAVLESVRDALVAVWDEVGWPGNFEAIDANIMLVQEARALANMAEELGKQEEAKKWRARAESRIKLINEYGWDTESGFYYQVDKSDNDFTYENPNDLKRQEIWPFLALWAEVASVEQGTQLVEKLTDPRKFWRQYGVPSLAADDPYYNPQGYWNGPVWVEWNYLILNGLLQYGFETEAVTLLNKVAAIMIDRLKTDHTFWEFYSPDDRWGGHHQTYIWAGIINRMIMEVKQPAFYRK